MNFFKYLTWNNSHMDLRYVENPYGGDIRITKLYRDPSAIDLERINREYGEEVASAQRAISGNRMGMLLIFMALVFMPALVLSVIQSNVLLIAVIIIYSIIAYFVVEAINQVEINRVLYQIDSEERRTSDAA
ncbi:hypothetical protein [Salinicoccus sp. CNSTN-B1]